MWLNSFTNPCLCCFCFQFWFRNRRARSKRAEREKIAAYSTIPTNRFERPGAERLPAQSPMYSTADQLLWFRARSDCSPTITDREDQPRLQLVKRENGYPQIKPNQFRTKHSFTPLPMYHPDRFKIRHAEPARLPTSRVSPRYQPYWVPWASAVKYIGSLYCDVNSFSEK